MQIYHSFIEIERPHASVCVVGAFDGVHLGHQQLLRAAVDDAYARGLPSAVITFFPNPRVVLGRAPAFYLTLPDEKARQMQLLGIDMLIELAFTRETIQTPAAEFVRLMLEHLRLVSLWIGPDFALGNKRQGDAAYLLAQGALYGFSVNVMSPVSALMKMTGILFGAGWRRKISQTERPSRSGSKISSRIRFGFIVRAWLKAWTPSLATIKS